MASQEHPYNNAYPCSWCQSGQCNQSQANTRHCAGPYSLTGEDRIGDRECCNNLKKCSDPWGIKQWCSTNGKCPDFSPNSELLPQPFQSYSQVIVPKIKEGFSQDGMPSGRRGTYSRMDSL